MNNKIAKSTLVVSSMLTTANAYANVILPSALAAAIPAGIKIFLWLIVVPLEAIIIHAFLQNRTTAFLMSLAGNLASTILGTLIMLLPTTIFEIFLIALFGSHAVAHNTILFFSIVIFMALGSFFLEVLVVGRLFKYSFKQLWKPFLTANLASYAVITIALMRR